MPVYVIVQGKIENRKLLDQYLAKAGPTVEAHQGRLIAYAEEPEVIPHPPQQSIKPSRKNDRSGTTGGIRLLLPRRSLGEGGLRLCCLRFFPPVSPKPWRRRMFKTLYGRINPNQPTHPKNRLKADRSRPKMNAITLDLGCEKNPSHCERSIVPCCLDLLWCLVFLVSWCSWCLGG
jgi:hypothetical protein